MELSRVIQESETEKIALRRAQPDDFGRNVSKIVVAQICAGVGFDCIQKWSLEALSSVVKQYICDLGKLATSYASLSCRTECNVFDIVKGLQDLGSIRGFSDGSRVKECLVDYRIVKGISQFMRKVEDIPFAQSIPRFPVIKTSGLDVTFSEMGTSQSSKHIPDWLPAFPDPHTYMHSPVCQERNIHDKVKLVKKQRKKGEQSWLNFQRRLLANGKDGDVAMEDDLYRCPPLPAREKDEKHMSVQEAFAQIIHAFKGRASSDEMDVDRRVVLGRWPVVHFKLKIGRKMSIDDLDVHLRNKGNEKKRLWFPRNEEKDKKKRKVELILRQSYGVCL
ncbi:transcription initiation factor TFIID subunit 8-like [Silene latifolia]|uniref:transcription initiation factor TFIID subunit 8-like n=1 Tax=Silene latifolia TaxID=37657 RepID=UPI003D7800D6